MDYLNKNLPISEDQKLVVDGVTYDQVRWIRHPVIFSDNPVKFTQDVTISDANVNITGSGEFQINGQKINTDIPSDLEVDNLIVTNQTDTQFLIVGEQTETKNMIVTNQTETEKLTVTGITLLNNMNANIINSIDINTDNVTTMGINASNRITSNELIVLTDAQVGSLTITDNENIYLNGTSDIVVNGTPLLPLTQTSMPYAFMVFDFGAPGHVILGSLETWEVDMLDRTLNDFVLTTPKFLTYTGSQSCKLLINVSFTAEFFINDPTGAIISLKLASSDILQSSYAESRSLATPYVDHNSRMDTLSLSIIIPSGDISIFSLRVLFESDRPITLTNRFGSMTVMGFI